MPRNWLAAGLIIVRYKYQYPLRRQTPEAHEVAQYWQDLMGMGEPVLERMSRIRICQEARQQVRQKLLRCRDTDHEQHCLALANGMRFSCGAAAAA